MTIRYPLPPSWDDELDRHAAEAYGEGDTVNLAAVASRGHMQSVCEPLPLPTSFAGDALAVAATEYVMAEHKLSGFWLILLAIVAWLFCGGAVWLLYSALIGA